MSQKALADDVWNRYQQLRDNGHQEFCAKFDRCKNFFIGKQWNLGDLAFLKAVKRPALTINMIMSTLSNVMGEQIYNRTDVAYQPRNNGATAEVADALTTAAERIAKRRGITRADLDHLGLISQQKAKRSW